MINQRIIQYLRIKYIYKVNTQYSVENGFIDLVIIASNNIGFICEHKINSKLSEKQISKYFNCKDEIDANIIKTVLVTKSDEQHTQEADISIT